MEPEGRHRELEEEETTAAKHGTIGAGQFKTDRACLDTIVCKVTKVVGKSKKANSNIIVTDSLADKDSCSVDGILMVASPGDNDHAPVEENRFAKAIQEATLVCIRMKSAISSKGNNKQ